MDKFIQNLKKKFFKDNPALLEKIDRVKEKGHTKLTIYLIPHGYDKTFNFHISIFTIAFFFLLILALIGLSIYGIYRSSYTRSEIAKLQSVHGKYFSSYLESRSFLEEIDYDYNALEQNLSEIYVIFDGDEEELLKLEDEDEIQRIAWEEIRKEEKKDTQLMEGRSYLKEIYSLRELKHSMNSRKKLLDANSDYYFNRANTLFKTPIRNPMSSWNLTSPFGMRKSPTSGFFEFHDGVDMANASGTPIYSTAPGKVIRVVYSNTGYGYHIVMEHEFGYKTLYAHCSKIFVKVGQYVEGGKKIAEVGATGNVTGPHLHYEIMIGEGNKIDPDEYLNAHSL